MECLEKIKRKNMGRNPDVLHFLMKDYDYQNKDAKNLIEEPFSCKRYKICDF